MQMIMTPFAPDLGSGRPHCVRLTAGEPDQAWRPRDCIMAAPVRAKAPFDRLPGDLGRHKPVGSETNFLITQLRDRTPWAVASGGIARWEIAPRACSAAGLMSVAMRLSGACKGALWRAL
jgi:hypothetical protein